MECIERFNSIGGPLSVVAAATEVWASGSGKMVTFHDPLAASLIFEPEICTYDAGRVTVELESTPLAGLTMFERNAAGPHHIARGVEPEKFFAEYWRIVSA
jgi:purine nucleosidase